MRVRERVEMYKGYFMSYQVVDLVREVIDKGIKTMGGLDALEVIRDLNTELADLYMVSIPVITCWVRDDCYIPETGEIYLCEPSLEGFLHQFRHHLQNVERKYERRGLLMDGMDKSYWKVPYEECVHSMRGEDDARAWSKAIIELALEIEEADLNE